MKYNIEKAFKKDFDKLKDKKLAATILKILENVEQAPTETSIKSLKKLKGYENAYRIRVGNYRIGLIIENNVVSFVAFAHRKEIYRNFP